MGTDEKQLAREHEERMRKIELKNIELEYRNEERDAMMRKPKKKLEESKFYIRLMFILVFEIIIFAETVMWRTGDLSSLYALIGISATLVGALVPYYMKAKAQNTVGGITYDTAMADYYKNKEIEEEDDDVTVEGSVG